MAASYTWVRKALQGAGLVSPGRKRGVHRRRRERRPLPGMLLRMDRSRHCWFQEDRWYDLLVILGGYARGGRSNRAELWHLAGTVPQ